VTDKDGVTVREQLQAQLGRTKKPARIRELEADLAMPRYPEELAYIWRAYNRIRARKGSGFAGRAPIEWPDIDAFCRNTRTVLAPWEIEIIEALDNAFMAVKQQPSP